MVRSTARPSIGHVCDFGRSEQPFPVSSSSIKYRPPGLDIGRVFSRQEWGCELAEGCGKDDGHAPEKTRYAIRSSIWIWATSISWMGLSQTGASRWSSITSQTPAPLTAQPPSGFDEHCESLRLGIWIGVVYVDFRRGGPDNWNCLCSYQAAAIISRQG